MEGNKSEVARLRAQLAAECEAAYLGLHGPSLGTSQHQTITARMERMQQVYDALSAVDEDAAQFLAEMMDRH